ncbi:MAG: ABC transporter permease [Saprospiraceae bacterium]|nr:ABC transporter permease [Saprospiraceae bacterium]MDP4699897.1 ABC transporter permease [Saprospiraceae bacterium]MDP4814757.1 ABC transporter permease [Saprospiraceae bacterium]MDP4852051.1 ABC transporter permease [Saprospiraceae bacterium]MDP5049616.1 ABC transporter permease [Saprospiraceae bacterium]
MNTLLVLLQKEFKQIFRNTLILRMIIAMPIVQLLVMPLAADYEIKNIEIAIVDEDQTALSRQLIHHISASGYFNLVSYGANYKKALQLIEKDKAVLALQIPSNFEKDLHKEDNGGLFLAINAINGMKANVGSAYLGQIIRSFNQELRLKTTVGYALPIMPLIEIIPVNWFNPLLNYRIFMVPGILVLLVTMIGSYMCALNIVKEKEIGTIEQINVSPIKKSHFILAKLIPFWIIGQFVFTIGLFGIARLVYGIVPEGNLLIIYGFLSIYLVAILGIGLLISTYSENQQQAMSLTFFFMMIFILMGGLFTPIESMPDWAQWVASLNPVSYFIEVMRMVISKGSQWQDLKSHFVVMTLFALFFNTWALLNYKKTS